MQMAQTIFGDGVTVVNASYSGDNRSSGIFSDGDSVSPGVTPGDTGVILSTGHAQDFTNEAGTSGGWWWGGGGTPDEANQSADTSTNSSGFNNNSQFNAAAGTRTYDGSMLTVDFIPTGDTMTMQFVFASEEFPEYANSQYQDFVGVWVNGAPAEMAVGSANPGNLVGGVNQNLYNDNTDSQFNTEMDGFTVTMTLTFPVTAGQVNTIQIGIADVGDTNYDSNLLIAGDSLQTVLIAHDDIVHLPAGDTKTIDVLANDFAASGGVIAITHINGEAVSAGDTITLATGQTVTLNADGTFTMVSDGDDEYFNFTYTIDDGSGNTDTGFVLVDSIPCFTAGTMIETERGPRPVESLRVGDLVLTQDHGLQELRWIGGRRVRAEGSHAPIHIAPGTFGAHGALRLSPLHRVLLRDGIAEMLFGAEEVLIAARDLVDGGRVRAVEGGSVDYIHLLFERHQIVFAEGLATESFLPGPQMKHSFEAGMVEEIRDVIPGFDPETGAGYGPAARRMLKRYEAELLRGGGRMARRAA